MKVLCMGDSITYGTGCTPGSSYPEILAASLGRCFRDVSVLNDGIPGNSTKEYWEYLQKSTSAGMGHSSGKERYDAIVIMLGTNDCRRDNWVETGDSVAYLIRIIEFARQMLQDGGTVFLCTILPLADPMPLDILGGHHGWEQKRVENEINPAIKQLAGFLQVELIDVYTSFKTELDRGKALYDGIHPFDSGYAILADTISNSVINVEKQGNG